MEGFGLVTNKLLCFNNQLEQFKLISLCFILPEPTKCIIWLFLIDGKKMFFFCFLFFFAFKLQQIYLIFYPPHPHPHHPKKKKKNINNNKNLYLCSILNLPDTFHSCIVYHKGTIVYHNHYYVLSLCAFFSHITRGQRFFNNVTYYTLAIGVN